MTDWATAIANRKRLGYTLGTGGTTNNSRLIGDRPMTSSERQAKLRPYIVPDPEPDQTWRAQAACQGLDTNLFYSDHNDHQAINVCHTCPVMWPCRYDALDVQTINQYGVAGGLDATTRRRMRRRWEYGQLDPTIMRQRKQDAHAVSVQLRVREVAA